MCCIRVSHLAAWPEAQVVVQLFVGCAGAFALRACPIMLNVKIETAASRAMPITMYLRFLVSLLLAGSFKARRGFQLTR